MSRDLITFRCPQCQAALSLPASLAGAAGPCLYCETEIIGPNPDTGQPAQLAQLAQLARTAQLAAPSTPANPQPSAAARHQEFPAPVPPAPLELEPLEVGRPAATSAPSRSSVFPQESTSAFPYPRQVSAPPTQTYPTEASTRAIAPRQPEPAPRQPEPAPRQPEPAPRQPEPAPRQPEPAPRQPEPAPRQPEPASRQLESPAWEPFAPPAERASPGPFPPRAQTTPPSTLEAASAPPFSFRDYAPPVSPSAPPADPFGQQWQPQARPSDPFAHLQSQPQPKPPFFEDGPGDGYPGYPAGSDIPPHPAASLNTWQDIRSSNLPRIPGLPGAGALRELTEKLRTSPLAPLAVVGTLVLLLVIFGIYLLRDYKELTPNAGTDTPSPSPATTPATGPGPGSTPAIPVLDPVATTTPNPTNPPGPEPATPEPAPATSPNPNPNPNPNPGPATNLTGDPGIGPVTDPAPTATNTNTNTTPPATTPTPDIEAPGGLLDGPVGTLNAFVSAATWGERINYALYPEVVKPLMEIYYRNFPDGVVVPESIRFQHSETDPETGKRFFVFHVTTEESLDGFPVLIEETSGGFGVDWETFVEFKDDLFHRFSSNPSPGKLGAFHLIMRNAHYFGEDFPELKGLTPYRLDPPIPNQEAYAFALTDSAVNKELQKQVTWGMNFTPFLELRWAKSQNGTDYLQVVSVLHTNWRNRTP